MLRRHGLDSSPQPLSEEGEESCGGPCIFIPRHLSGRLPYVFGGGSEGLRSSSQPTTNKPCNRRLSYPSEGGLWLRQRSRRPSTRSSQSFIVPFIGGTDRLSFIPILFMRAGPPWVMRFTTVAGRPRSPAPPFITPVPQCRLPDPRKPSPPVRTSDLSLSAPGAAAFPTPLVFLWSHLSNPSFFRSSCFGFFSRSQRAPT